MTTRPPGKPRTTGPRPAAQQRPLPEGDTMFTPSASPGRRAVEQASARPLVYLHQLPRWLPPALLVALLVTGLAVPGALGTAALLVVAAFLGWLAYLGWPALHPQGRALRVLALAALIALAVVQARR